MTFSRIRSIGTWTGTILTAELEAFDDHLSKAIDGDGGGSYAPTNPIIIGGDGVQFTTPGTFDELAGNFLNTAALQATSSTLSAVAITGAFAITGNATFSANLVEVQAGMHFGGSGSLNIERPVTVAAATTFQCDAPSSFNGALTATVGIKFTGGTKGLRRRVAYAPDSNSTRGVVNGDVIIWDTSMTATHTTNLADGVEGEELILLNTSPTYAQTLRNSAGAPLVAAPNSVPVLSGTTPGKVHLYWGQWGSGNFAWIGA